jgi:uncharacterized protein (DUF433 family)
VETPGRQATVPFVGFAEAFVFAFLRRAKMKESRIREGVAAVRQERGLEYALASRSLWTDRAELLTGEAGSDLTVARTGQAQFSAFVQDQLIPVVYADDGYAARIRLPQFQATEVVVDPTVAFGSPIVEPHEVRVVDLVSRWLAGDTMHDLSLDYGVPLTNVEEVIRAQARKPQGLPAS